MTDILNKNGVSYTFVKTARFKTTLISVGFYTPLCGDAAANSLACSLMRSGTEALPDSYSFQRRLASLYGAGITSWTAKTGDAQELRIGITVNDDKYTFHDERNVDEAGKLLCDMIFGRFLSGADYPADAVAREKRLLCESIAGKLNDKRVFARKRCEEIMCGDEPYGLSPDGTAEEVEALTNDGIKAAFVRLLKHSRISVLVIGSEEPAEFVHTFAACLEQVGRDYRPLPEDRIAPAGNLKTVEEKMPVKQGKLVLGLRSESGGGDAETTAAWIMTDMFGGGPYSKLFNNVREKLSLCYYCSARAVRRKGLMFIESGVEESNIAAAREAIMGQLDDMKNGNFTEKDIRSSKLALCDMIRSAESDQPTLARWYAARALEKKIQSPQEACAAIENITREDIINAANGFCLDTVYILSPDGKEAES